MKKRRGLSVSVVVRTERQKSKPPVDLLHLRVRSLARAVARAWIERTNESGCAEISEQSPLVNARKP
jgi:hypothetical protein